MRMTWGLKVLSVSGSRSHVLAVAAVMATAGILALTFTGGCSKERPLKPTARDFVLYAGGSIWDGQQTIDRLYILDVDSLSVLDSLAILANSAAASPDGQFLYAIVYDENDDRLVTSKIDLRSKRALWTSSEERDHSPRLRLVDCGKRLFQQRGSPDCGLLEVSIDDGRVVDRRGGLCYLGDASVCSDVLPIIQVDGDGTTPTLDTIVQLVDVKTGDSRNTVVPRLPDGRAVAIKQVTLHPDGKRLLILGFNCDSECFMFFTICDASTGWAEYVWPLPPLATGTGYIAVSEDGRYAALDDAGNQWTTDQFVEVFDLRGNKDLEHFRPVDGFNPVNYRLGEMVFLPDNRRVVIQPAGFGIGPLRVIDVHSLTMSDPIWLPHSSPDGWWYDGRAILVGPRPPE